ncbi:hypothetical protein [Halostella sp. PRR32]|uniref:hypothetical protein n=1 Tax=Halostella sp. PRR32 TaxID=3098147 RepID=UPI002B1D7F22|nr:hypothetical protein [Halostella sp. PRR32]
MYRRLSSPVDGFDAEYNISNCPTPTTDELFPLVAWRDRSVSRSTEIRAVRVAFEFAAGPLVLRVREDDSDREGVCH